MRWKRITSYPNYFVSDAGTVRNKHGRMIYLDYDPHGYRRVKLWKDGKAKNRRVHILVAQAFLDHYDGCDVNHKDRDKNNNRASNLECISHQENMRHWMEDDGVLKGITEAHVGMQPLATEEVF